ncbi:hypothetical protein N657DRAFT_448546 [Parathielavia appendiculata]|uniref:Uncharacterized protein n=1 Tax=Parathielavia appendiculata TaxID=2587402 RepID=A0AAN6TYJ4_9PEZI|nr:hypothetical protein N657DRAFT_448546 [Parathielavia appendiculata]
MTSLCPKISTLDLAAPQDATICAFCPQRSMLSPRDVEVVRRHEDGEYQLVQLFPLFRAAPNIALLRLFRLGCCATLKDSLRLERLTDLELQACCITNDELARILRLCPNPQRLRYVCCRPEAIYRDEHFTPDEVVAVVLEQTPNLQTFELDLTELMETENFTENDVRKAKSALSRRGIKCIFTVLIEWKLLQPR